MTPPWLFEEVALEWARDDVLQPWLVEALRRVHTDEYLDFLEKIYSEWIGEGGSKVCAACRFLLKSNSHRTPSVPDLRAPRNVLAARLAA